MDLFISKYQTTTNCNLYKFEKGKCKSNFLIKKLKKTSKLIKSKEFCFSQSSSAPTGALL